MFFGYKGDCCLLEPDTSCAYQMQVLPEAEQSVEVLLWKSKFNENDVLLKQGTLEIVVEGQVLGKCDASVIPAGQFTKVSSRCRRNLSGARPRLKSCSGSPRNPRRSAESTSAGP